MLYRITGPAGSGKTEYMYQVLQSLYEAGASCVWIAPEQQSVQVEREILDRLGDGCNLSVEILNFERLPERIAREHGDLAVVYPDKGALCALLSVLMYENRKRLTEYGASAEDAEFASNLLGLFGRLRSECIRPEALYQAAEQVEHEGKLRAKLTDLAILFEAYDAYFDETRRDPRDALTVLASMLDEKPFFAGKTVFVDGYYTFTGQEHALLDEIIKQADAVYCSFTYDGRELFERNESCAFRVAKHANGCRTIPVGAYKRSTKDELVFLEQHLWSGQKATFAGDKGAVRIVTAENVFLESEAVAREILRLVQGGMRYRDITVLARGVQRYDGVLDTVLAMHEIPFFMSQKEPLVSRPLAAFVCAALELVISDLSLYAWRKYLKSGYSVLTVDEADVLLRYAESWNLRANDWLSGESFTRNPDGYSDRPMDETQTALLDAVNAAREKVLPAVLSLRDEIKGASNAREYLSALYRHLERVHAADRFAQKLNRMQRCGETLQASRDSMLWERLIGIMERIDEICGDKPITAKRMLALFRLTASQYHLGAIPHASDSVTVGEASLARPDHARAVIVMGCNDGVFPAAVGGDPMFDSAETVQLESVGISVTEPPLARLSEERFYFYSAVASPSEILILTYPISDGGGDALRPSPAVERIRKLLPHVETEHYDGTGERALFSAQNAAALFHALPDGSQKDELASLLAQKGVEVPPLRGRLVDLIARIENPSSTLRLSPSGIERYRFCPFSYFGGYVLRLKEKKKNRFATQEIGTFIHAILEQFLRAHTQSGKFVPSENDAELEREADELIERYFLAVVGGLAGKSKRFLHTYRNLRKTLLILLRNLTEEFRDSDFLPSGFEVNIGMGGGLPAVEFVTEDGKRVYLCGSIDRVDLYKKDGVTYVRVVDYKTYGKTLKMDYVREYGLDEQMLLYLFAYCKQSAADGEVFVPAGVLYDKATLPFVAETGNETPEELKEKQDAELKRTGIILEDTSVALAMDRKASGKYLPVTFDENGVLKSGKGTMTESGFEELRELLETQILSLADAVFDGDMDVRPLILDDHHDACHYCNLKSACRYQKDEKGDE